MLLAVRHKFSNDLEFRPLVSRAVLAKSKETCQFGAANTRLSLQAITN